MKVRIINAKEYVETLRTERINYSRSIFILVSSGWKDGLAGEKDEFTHQQST